MGENNYTKFSSFCMGGKVTLPEEAVKEITRR